MMNRLNTTPVALFVFTALAIGASSPATAAKHKSSSSSDVQSKAEAEIAITKQLLKSRENNSETTTTQRRRQPTPAAVAPPTPPNVGAVPPPTPPNVGTNPSNSSSASTTGSTAALDAIKQYFTQYGAPASSSATLPKGTQLNVGAQVPTGVPLYPLPNDLKNQPTTSNYAYFVSGNSVVVVDSESKTIAGVYPTHH